MTKKPKAPSGADQEASDFLDESDSDVVEKEPLEEEEEEEGKPLKRPNPTFTPQPPKRLQMVADNRPTAAVLRGRFGKFRVPATLGLSSQMLPPLTKKTFASYELCGFFDTQGKKKLDRRIVDGPQEVDAPDYQLVDNYDIYDRFEQDLAKTNKTLNFEKGVIQKMPITKESKMLMEINKISPIFRTGQLRVEIERQYCQYVWLELHPFNETGKFRDKQKPPIFRRTDLLIKSSHSEILRMDLQQAAYLYVRKLDKTALVALASAMTNPTISVTGTTENDIRQALLLRSRSNPEEVMYSSPDKTNACVLDILNAMDWGILDFDATHNSYSFTNLPDETVYVVPLEEKTTEGFAKFLLGQVEGEEEQGQEAYKYMKSLVSFWAP